MAEIPYWTSNNWFLVRQINRQFRSVKQRVQAAGLQSAGDMRNVLAAIDQLEVDVGRVLLKVHAIAEVLEQKGLVTGEELADRALELDGLDGSEDGILHPSLFRTEEEQQRAPSPRAFLHALEQKAVNPKDFLASLEEGEQ